MSPPAMDLGLCTSIMGTGRLCMHACTCQLAARSMPRHALTTSRYDSEGRLNRSGGSVPVMEL